METMETMEIVTLGMGKKATTGMAILEMAAVERVDMRTPVELAQVTLRQVEIPPVAETLRAMAHHNQ
jgi:hypothetical protein